MDAGLKRDLEEKVRASVRLTREDGIALYDSDDLAWLGGLAHEVRSRKNGDVVFFNINRHLTLTERDGHTRSVEEVVQLATGTADGLGGSPDGLTELHITGGLHPTLPWSFYPSVLRALKEALPRVSLKAFTATEIHHFEKISGLPAADVLDELVDAGLESLTGGGAEIFDPQVREQIVDHDTHWEDWSRIHRLAHGKGLKTPCSMLYGHVEEPRHRVDHVLRLRELQDATGGFQVFVPLLPQRLDDLGGGTSHARPGQRGSAPIQHEPTGRQDGTVPGRLPARAGMATGAEALKTFAVSRLLFDNVPHIGAFWVTHGVRTAQLALQHGADDMDGPVVAYPTTHDAAGSGTPDQLTREDFLDLIRDAGFRPVERNTRYEIIREYEGVDPGRRDVPQPMRV